MMREQRMNPHHWQSQIEDIADRASKDSGTSYDEYIRLFTQYFDRAFKRRPSMAVRIACDFGYSPELARKEDISK
ncbi:MULTISPECIES: hypothetical protein [Vibrio]|nr:hypothetical protein [Vibrio parahaemolyticus]MCZ5870609.1 hypothetical protein [Vibrio parahaemolyticus]MCZ6309161.1 hypothetical protein [Vibrio parahaemolyticus]MCZ6386788.1 hypothetical protein [Vibrio parahaemolyticus]MDF4504606.1 hypothetical protein [Vibrio parahaemolyticus]MDF4583385.1 hypothetical protein [Vibrio parahaemolyticus]